MIPAQENIPRLTPDEFLVWEEQQELRYNYIELLHFK